jgi:GTP-binding protein
MQRNDLRNIAIIAHVDHGKTSLVDCLLRQSGHFRQSQLVGDCILDSNDLERERGITIVAKNIALTYNDVKINIIDTPGHADFGGEVERVLRMADGALVLVDAFEGPRPQTRFVLKKAMECGLKLMVVVNKIDRADCRPEEVLSETFDLLSELGADDATLDFPYIFTSARDGYATHNPSSLGKDADGVRPLLNMIVEHIPAPVGDQNAPFQMTVTTIDYSDYVGRIATGRIANGRVAKGEQIVLMRAGGELDRAEVTSVEVFDKLGRTEVPTAAAGDIAALMGLPNPEIGDTIACPNDPRALTRINVDEPTLSMLFTINSSPLAGREGRFVTSRHLRERLFRELQSNLALRVEETGEKDSFQVSGRGVLHLSILIEQMRREDYEISVGKPQVIQKQIEGQWHEPFEELVIDVPTEDVGSIMEIVCARRGQIGEMSSGASGITHLEFSIPARGLIGLRTRLLNASRGQAVIFHRFECYRPREGDVPHRPNGVLVSQANGVSVGYALWKLQERAEMFVGPGEEIYEGMIVGENSRDNDLVVNPMRTKKLTNIRAAGSDDNILLKAPKELSLEAALEYIESDEYVEITPGAIRLRKILLAENARRRAAVRKTNGT